MAIIDEILASYESLRADHEALHQDPHPELSHQEHRTGRRVGERLREDGSRSPAASAARRHRGGGRPGQRQRARRPAPLRARRHVAPVYPDGAV
jgi:metal-dependent amidase/aminoacylase/carboxypeptidase family protein